MTSIVTSSKSSSLTRAVYTPEIESPVEDFMEQVVKFNKQHVSLCSQLEYRGALDSGSEAYEEISLSLQSTPECTKNHINLNTNPELYFDEPSYEPRHKRVKSHPADLSNFQANSLATLKNRSRGCLGFSEILAAINAGSNCSTIVKPIGPIDSLDFDSSTFILQQSNKFKKGIDFESVISEDEDSVSLKDYSDISRKHSYGRSPQFSDPQALSEPLGVTECTTMCYRCNKLVSTSVEFYEGPVPSLLLTFLEKVIGCCSSPIWLNKYKVHKCTLCKSVLS